MSKRPQTSHRSDLHQSIMYRLYNPRRQSDKPIKLLCNNWNKLVSQKSSGNSFLSEIKLLRLCGSQ